METAFERELVAVVSVTALGHKGNTRAVVAQKAVAGERPQRVDIVAALNPIPSLY
jgi:hypothetical protein